MHKVYIETAKWKKNFNKIISCVQNSKMPDIAIEKYIRPMISFTILTTTPDTESEKLFYDMWKNANRKEKQALASMLIKVIKEKN